MNAALDTHLSLAALHNDEFLLRGRPGEDDLGVVLQDVVKRLRGQVLQVPAVDTQALAQALGTPVPRLPGVDFIDWDVQTSSDVLDSLVAFRDDPHTLSNGLRCDWMITCHHDYLGEGTGVLMSLRKYTSMNNWRKSRMWLLTPWFRRSCICRRRQAQQHEEGRSWTWGRWSTASPWGSSLRQCQKQSPLGTPHRGGWNGRNLAGAGQESKMTGIVAEIFSLTFRQNL